jgi:hypothetical protein
MPATLSWATLATSLVTVWFAIRYWGFPLLASIFGNVTATRLTPFSARGVEWRKNKDASLPTFRVERVDWCLGGMEEAEIGLFVLTINGVSLRVKEEAKSGVDDDITRSHKVRLPSFTSGPLLTSTGDPSFVKPQAASCILGTTPRHSPLPHPLACHIHPHHRRPHHF